LEEAEAAGEAESWFLLIMLSPPRLLPYGAARRGGAGLYRSILCQWERGYGGEQRASLSCALAAVVNDESSDS
jgi:hypothetical protein